LRSSSRDPSGEMFPSDGAASSSGNGSVVVSPSAISACASTARPFSICEK